MTPDRLTPLLHAPVLPMMALIALAIVAVYGWAGLRRAGRAPWAPTVLRILAVVGIVVPGWAILEWYRDLARARELTRAIEIGTAPIVERFIVNAAALLSLGFLLLVAGIYLARRVGARDKKMKET